MHLTRKPPPNQKQIKRKKINDINLYFLKFYISDIIQYRINIFSIYFHFLTLI